MRATAAGCLGVFFVIVSSAFAEVPQYKLPVGRKIAYTTTTETKGDSVGSGNSTVELTVVRENPDGSRRIVVKTSSQRERDGKATQNVELSYADIFPDGRSTPNSLTSTRANPAIYLPPLPKDDAEMKKSWFTSNEEQLADVTYTPKTSNAKEFNFVGVEGGLMNKIYVSTRTDTFHLDVDKGIIAEKKTELSQDYGFHTRSASKMTLTSDETLAPTETSRLAAEYDLLFNTREKYHDKMVSIEQDRAHLDTIAADAKAMVDAALAKAKSEPVKGALTKIRDDHEAWVSECKGDGDHFKDVLNLPSPDWSAKDIDGNAVKISDFRGKIVVMDFWYRGCGWCMYAMPQVKKLSEDFKDKNVVVLGMNTDRKDEDARFVIDAMGLKYQTIKAEGIPEKYGVRGFPTLIIIDQQGVVRDAHVGYSATLRQDLTKKLNALLAKPAASAASPAPAP